MTKWYINKQRTDDKQLYFFELLIIIRKKVKILIFTNNMNDRQNRPWEGMLDEIL